jgi:hypothetical protein
MRIHSLALFLKSDPMGNGNEITVSSSDASRIFIYLFFHSAHRRFIKKSPWIWHKPRNIADSGPLNFSLRNSIASYANSLAPCPFGQLFCASNVRSNHPDNYEIKRVASRLR